MNKPSLLKNFYKAFHKYASGASRAIVDVEAPEEAEDVFISGFNEQPPKYPGGIWLLRNDRLEELYKGYGIFGLAWSAKHSLLFGVTRVEQPPIIVFRRSDKREYLPVRVEYENYVPARRAHGIYIFENHLYVVATQGDPDSPFCVNEDFIDHRVGKIIITEVEVRDNYILLRDSRVWNPYECEHHHHYNDILVDENFIYLASFSTCDEQKRYISRGAVTRFNHQFSAATIITDDLVAPHSLRIFDDRLYLCSSGSSSVVSLPLDVQQATTRLEFKTLNNFIRGLNVTADSFLIGLSRSAGRRNSAPFTESINGILKYDRKDGTTTRIEMPSDCDNLYFILSLSGL